jgi:hypothetical protein
MGIFGWSYPPGCSGTPYDEPDFCDVCGGNLDADECLCEECPVCEEVGRPECYTEHGMTLTDEVKAVIAAREAETIARLAAEADGLAASMSDDYSDITGVFFDGDDWRDG